MIPPSTSPSPPCSRFLAFVLFWVVMGVLADPIIYAPLDLIQCKYANITGYGAHQPLTIKVLSSFDSSVIRDLGVWTSGRNDDAYVTVLWITDVAAGTAVTFQVEDLLGKITYSKSILVNPSTNLACLSPSATANTVISNSSIVSSRVTTIKASSTNTKGHTNQALIWPFVLLGIWILISFLGCNQLNWTIPRRRRTTTISSQPTHAPRESHTIWTRYTALLGLRHPDPAMLPLNERISPHALHRGRQLPPFGTTQFGSLQPTSRSPSPLNPRTTKHLYPPPEPVPEPPHPRSEDGVLLPLECPICFEDMTGRIVKGAPCEHTLCRDCRERIIASATSDQPARCHACRMPYPIWGHNDVDA